MPATVSNAHDPRPPASTPAGPVQLSPAGREVRLGLVVYGGVSLAIYINGVANELFRAARGRGIYKLLKRLLDADIVVDIVSGTSAGGINGLLLAYALCNRLEFSECATLWREHGSLAKLLRLIDDEANATSLLDSRNYYIPQLENALRKMGPISSAHESSDRPSRFDELDLFVTGTNFDGHITTTVDSTGRQIDVKTHRTVFHLKHRAGRKEPLSVSPGATSAEDRARVVSALARLAAITSCFPAAFEPVKVAPSDDPHEQAVYNLLKEWGQLNGDAWFLDGGVLDNKPFSYTIQEIFNRTASRPVERKLFYVEPDPERFNPSARPVRVGPPTAVESAADALLGIPGYESIGEDLEHIAKRNDRLQRQTRAREAAQEAFVELREQWRRAPQTAIPPSVTAIYKHTRLTQLSERAVKGLMEGEGFTQSCGDIRKPTSAKERRDKVNEDRARRDAATALARAFDAWEGSGDETLERFDVYFRIRRMFHVIYKLGRKVTEACGAATDDKAVNANAALPQMRRAWETLNQQLGAYEIVQWAMERVLDLHAMPTDFDQVEGSAQRVWLELQTQFENLLAVDRLKIAPLFAPAAFNEERRKRLYEVLGSRLKNGTGQRPADGAAPDAAPNLLQRLDAHTRQLLGEQLPSHLADLADEWDEFVVSDAHFFPIDYFGDLGEKDPIDVVRISPLDAERAFCARRFEDKVTGETVMHFGAFLKKSWRSNDIMWGRLDGVCRMLDALLTPETLHQAVAKPAVRQLLRDDLQSGELDPAAIFPNAGPAIQKDLHAWLEQLASEDGQTRESAARDRDKHDLLLWCAQFEILDEDLPTVLVDAATEQLEWNNLSLRDSQGGTGFQPMGTRRDLASAVIAGEEITRQFIDRIKKTAGEFTEIRKAPLARHFLENYSVGSESAKNDIPSAVLLETITTSLLVARNCLVNAFPDQAGKITSSLIYKALVHWPLTTAHTLAVFARRERPFYLAMMAALLAYAVLALGALIWPGVSLRDDSGFDTMRIVFLVVLPLFVLIPGMRAAWAFARRGRGHSLLAQVSLVLLSFLSLSLALILFAAIAASWAAGNEQLRQWLAAPGVPGDVPAWLVTYAMVAAAIVFVLVVPALRGFIQTRVARRSM